MFIGITSFPGNLNINTEKKGKNEMYNKRDWLSWLGYKGPTPYPPDYEPIPWEFTLKDLESFRGEALERLEWVIKKALEAYPHIKEDELREAFDTIRQGEKTPREALGHIFYLSPLKHEIYIRSRIPGDWLDWLDFEPHQNTDEEIDIFIQRICENYPEEKKESFRAQLKDKAKPPKAGYAPLPRDFSEEELKAFKEIPRERFDKVIRNVLKAREYVQEEELQTAFKKIEDGIETPFEALAPILYLPLRHGGSSDSMKPSPRSN